MTHQGILGTLKARLERNRLGEVLVQGGIISAADLKRALDIQKEQRRPLGTVLREQGMVSALRLRRALFEQIAFRTLAAAVTIFISVSSFAPKQVRAAQIKDLPAQITLVTTFDAALKPLNYYPPIFNSEEKRSDNLRPFTKWSSMFDRLDRSMSDPSNQALLASWKQQLTEFQGLPLTTMVSKVNSFVNSYKYVADNVNWGQSDHWATPIEFFVRGGDCEDYAIAKYASLRALGVPEERLRLAIVHDRQKNVPHAVLIVYTDRGAMLLDNQMDSAKLASSVKHYRPIFSINRTAWWLHSKQQPDAIRVASAAE